MSGVSCRMIIFDVLTVVMIESNIRPFHWEGKICIPLCANQTVYYQKICGPFYLLITQKCLYAFLVCQDKNLASEINVFIQRMLW